MAKSLPTIPYIKGYPIKPQTIITSGEVLFTSGDGDNIRPNQQQCEAYGYHYNKETGTCSAFNFTSNLGRNLINENNEILTHYLTTPCCHRFLVEFGPKTYPLETKNL